MNSLKGCSAAKKGCWCNQLQQNEIKKSSCEAEEKLLVFDDNKNKDNNNNQPVWHWGAFDNSSHAKTMRR